MRVIAGSARGHNLKGPKSDATRPTSDMVRGAMFAILESMVDLEGARVLDLYAGTGALGIEALSRGAAWCDFVEDDRATCRIIAENLAHTKLADLARVHCHTVERVLGHPDMLGPFGRAGAGPNPPSPFPTTGRGPGPPLPLPAAAERRAGEERGRAQAVSGDIQGDARQESSPSHFTTAQEYDIILLDPPYALAESAAGGVWTVLARLAGGGYAKPGGLVVLEHSRRATPPETIGSLSLVKSRRHGDTCVTIYRMGANT